MRRQRFGFVALVVVACLGLAPLLHAEPLTLPLDKRPEWLRRDGIVMAGSWEPLVFRVRRDGSGLHAHAPSSSPPTSASTAPRWSPGSRPWASTS